MTNFHQLNKPNHLKDPQDLLLVKLSGQSLDCSAGFTTIALWGHGLMTKHVQKSFPGVYGRGTRTQKDMIPRLLGFA